MKKVINTGCSFLPRKRHRSARPGFSPPLPPLSLPKFLVMSDHTFFQATPIFPQPQFSLFKNHFYLHLLRRPHQYCLPINHHPNFLKFASHLHFLSIRFYRPRTMTCILPVRNCISRFLDSFFIEPEPWFRSFTF